MTRGVPLLEPADAIGRLTGLLSPLDAERVPLAEAAGRVLAQDVAADRPSPALDVSAMDGYAFAGDPTRGVPIEVAAESSAGRPPPELPPGRCVRIFTGAPVPKGATVVIPRERLEERDAAVVVPAELEIVVGQFIRRRGENAAAGDRLLCIRDHLGPLAMSTLAATGTVRPLVVRRVRVAVLVTGDEVRDPADAVEPWQLRDGNAATLRALFGNVAWLQLREPRTVSDDAGKLAAAIASAAAEADAVLVTGGVSMGDYDYTRPAIEAAGGSVIYHGLRMRPGKPNLGALLGGKPILGLPGNPMSVAVGARLLAAAVLRRLAGLSPERLASVQGDGDGKSIPLRWFRPVTIGESGRASLTANRSSGDVAGPATSNGVIDVPPATPTGGSHTFWPWTIT